MPPPVLTKVRRIDIETGSLAVSRSRKQQVRELGQSFGDAHSGVRQQGRDLARKLGVTPVLPAGDQGAAQHGAAMTTLKGKKGADFDKALVEKVAPARVGHLEMAKNLRARLGK